MNYNGYFDYAAATPLLPEVIAEMQPFLNERFYNASAIYIGGRKNKQTLDDARHSIASGLGAKPTELIFTAGGTEANNLAINGIMQQFTDKTVLTSAIEHESVLAPSQKYNHDRIAVQENGILNIADLKAKLIDDVVLISVMYANNEVGSIQPIKEIAELIKQTRDNRKKRKILLPLYLHTDACQATNYLDMQVSRLGVDMLTINAGKIYAPKQTGALYIKSDVRLNAQIVGGGQEWNMRSGTENIANIVGFATAFKKVRSDYKEETKRIEELQGILTSQLLQIDNITVNGPKTGKRLANNVHVTYAGTDNERLLMELDELGFQVATGSACSASNDEPSHVLKALGISDEQARSSIRITLGRYTTEQDVHNLVKAIKKVVV